MAMRNVSSTASGEESPALPMKMPRNTVLRLQVALMDRSMPPEIIDADIASVRSPSSTIWLSRLMVFVSVRK